MTVVPEDVCSGTSSAWLTQNVGGTKTVVRGRMAGVDEVILSEMLPRSLLPRNCLGASRISKVDVDIKSNLFLNFLSSID